MKQLLFAFMLLASLQSCISKTGNGSDYDLYYKNADRKLDSIQIRNMCLDDLPIEIKNLPDIRKAYMKNLDNYLFIVNDCIKYNDSCRKAWGL